MSPFHATVLAVAAPSPGFDACRRSLEAAGIRVLCSADPDAAIEIAAREPALDAVLVDAGLPGGLAGSLVSGLRADRRTRSLFIAVVPAAEASQAGPWVRPCVAALGSTEEFIGTLSGMRRFSRGHPEACLLERLLDSAPDPVLTVNRWGRIVVVNTQVEAVFGYSRAELLGQPVERLVPARVRPGHPALREKFMACAQARPMGAGLELHAVRRDGSEFPVEISLSPLEADGEHFVTAVVRDVTERRLVERALKENTEWLDAIFDASRDGIIVEDRERIIFVNRATVQLYGYDAPEELLGQHVSIVQAPEDNDRMLEFGRRRLAGEAVPAIYEFIGRRRDGSTLEVEASVASRTIGGQSLIITTVRDIAERKRADRERSRRLTEQAARLEAEAAEKRMAALYEDAREASRLKDEFLATLSHELRTPLNAMLGWARLLRAGALDAETSERALDSIERNARLQAQLVSDILDVSRIITGKLRLDSGLVDLVSLTQSGLDSIRPAADAKGVRIELHVEGELHPIHADGDRLLQVVWNLLSNAVKFTPPAGRVSVSLTGRPGSVEIRVSDTGAGISEAFLPFVFDRFRQADASTTRTHGGLGLGLAIVRHLVELHGGTVEALSEGEGRGATFVVRLPARRVRQVEPEPPALRPASPSHHAVAPPLLEGVRVLVVDDEADTRDLLLTALQARGASVVTAGSAAEAYDAFCQFHPDVLVADIGMPVEDGYSLMARIRALPEGEGGRTAAVALTAFAREQDREAALTAGFQRHLTKPFEPDDLAAVLAGLISGGEG
jgi:PAS domain S-box-containing protein